MSNAILKEFFAELLLARSLKRGVVFDFFIPFIIINMERIITMIILIPECSLSKVSGR